MLTITENKESEACNSFLITPSPFKLQSIEISLEQSHSLGILVMTCLLVTKDSRSLGTLVLAFWLVPRAQSH